MDGLKVAFHLTHAYAKVFADAGIFMRANTTEELRYSEDIVQVLFVVVMQDIGPTIEV